MMKMVLFTDQEITALRQMLDIALKALGGQAAGIYLVLDGKLKNATDDAEDTVSRSPG